MRRDICHYYEKDLKDVYNSYAKAAKDKFGKNCEYHNEYKMSFGLNFTFKYNMNGGACIIHFMPYKTGTAVNVRYTIAQLFGARYKAYDKDLTEFVVSVLGVNPIDIEIDPDVFEQYAISNQKSNNRAQENKNELNVVEELRQYKALLDEGVITAEEFEMKKKQLLGL